jgi:hypothetical protein
MGSRTNEASNRRRSGYHSILIEVSVTSPRIARSFHVRGLRIAIDLGEIYWALSWVLVVANFDSIPYIFFCSRLVRKRDLVLGRQQWRSLLPPFTIQNHNQHLFVTSNRSLPSDSGEVDANRNEESRSRSRRKCLATAPHYPGTAQQHV